MIAMLRAQLAAPGVTVTESKLLHDVHSGVAREVDVVSEGDFDGEHIVVSVEVMEWKKAVDLPKVEQLVKKHETLPTNRLLIVSWSGFTAEAQALLDATPRVDGVTPEHVRDDHGNPMQSQRLFVDQVSLAPQRCTMTVRNTDGSVETIAVDRGFVLFDAAGSELGSTGELVDEWLRRATEPLAMEAHGRDDRDSLTHFTVGGNLEASDLYMRFDPDDGGHEFHQVLGFECVGPFEWHQTELSFGLVEVSGRRVGTAQAKMFGHDSVWVAVPDPDDPTRVTISWQAEA